MNAVTPPKMNQSPAGALAASWPAHPPEFASVAPGPVLLVPFAETTADDAENPSHAHRGKIHAGAPIAPGADARHTALAPVAGEMRDSEEIVALTDGSSLRAARLLCASPDDEQPAPVPAEETATAGTMAALDVLRRGDLIEWTDRLRAAGIWADRRGSPDLIGQLLAAMQRPVDTIIC